jgi:hypothetical protein
MLIWFLNIACFCVRLSNKQAEGGQAGRYAYPVYSTGGGDATPAGNLVESACQTIRQREGRRCGKKAGGACLHSPVRHVPHAGRHYRTLGLGFLNWSVTTENSGNFLPHRLPFLCLLI